MEEKAVQAEVAGVRNSKPTEREKDSSTSNYIRLRGLPFSAKEDDVRAFLTGLEVKSVTFTLTSSGRASGECYVELSDKDAAEKARRFDKQEMSSRYIEVFSVPEGEVVWMIRHNVIRKGEQNTPYNCVVRLRGIPFNAAEGQIKEFFSGLEVADVVIDKEPGGRPSGEAFVRFASKQDAEMALERNRNNMGSRYVEVFRSSGDELEKAREGHNAPPTSLRSLVASRMYPLPRSDPVPLRFAAARLCVHPYRRDDYGGGPLRNVNLVRSRVAPYDVPPYSRYSRYHDYGLEDDLDIDDPAKIYMRGLPYNANALDIEDFFKPLNCVEIQLGYNEDRRPSGDACVIFGTIAEAREALNRNRECIGNRYIELFTAADVPITQKYVIYRRIGGTGGYPTGCGGYPLGQSGSTPGVSRPPTSLKRVAFGGYDDWNDNSALSGRYLSTQSKPVSLNRVGYATSDPTDVGGADCWSDADINRGYAGGYSSGGGYSASYATSGQQYYNDEYEGRQSSYGYHWGTASSSSVKATW